MKNTIHEALLQIDTQIAPIFKMPLVEAEVSPIVLKSRYFVETCFLKNYFSKTGFRIGQATPCDIREFITDALDGRGTAIEVCTKETKLTFIYFYGLSQLYLEHGLIVVIDDNMAYLRFPKHDPLTEWSMNELSDDFRDENGNFIFVGSPINF